MRTAATIAQRDAIKGVLMWVWDGAKWVGYETPAEIPAQLRPVQKTPQQIADDVALAEKDAADASAAASYAKLKALTQMSPTEVQTWVAANVTNITQAQDVIATLAIAVSVLARRL